MIGTFDLETSTFNKGNPYDPRNSVVLAQFKRGPGDTDAKFYDHPGFKTEIRRFLGEVDLLVGVNLKFDLAWLRNLGLELSNGIRIWDCMLAEFILSGQTNSFASLNSLCERYNLGRKDDAVAEYWARGVDTKDIPRDVLEGYGKLDVDLSYQVYQEQLKDPRMTPELHKLIILCGLDLLVLLDMEYNGMAYDAEASLAEAARLTERITTLEEELFAYAPAKFNIDSGDQLSCFLYGGTVAEDVYVPVSKVYKSGPKKGQEYLRNEFQYTRETVFPGFFKPLRGSELAKHSNDRPLYQTGDQVLQQLAARTKVQKRIIEIIRERSKLEKLVGTYLTALPAKLEAFGWGKTIHGTFNQVVAATGRLSSSGPNLQNMPAEADQFFISRYV
jgi:DNA polymerase I-like protein with 3'-5' exonuclease and polymerase domains